MTATAAATTCTAVCVLHSEASSTNAVVGVLTISQLINQTVQITGTLAGLTPGKHGLSICVSGNLSQGASSCGPVFNPFGKTHGAPEDAQRAVGDLGNVLADETGSANVDITDSIVSLLGPHSVIGRSIVVAAGEDDQGRGGHENSLTTGNPGPRMAAGVIGLVAN